MKVHKWSPKIQTQKIEVQSIQALKIKIQAEKSKCIKT